MSRLEVLAVFIVSVLVFGGTLPTISTIRCDSKKQRSTANLVALGLAHASYAADWNDRQFTLARDDLGVALGNCLTYEEDFGCHPPVVLGETCGGESVGFFFGADCPGSDGTCNDFPVVAPMNFRGLDSTIGAFRLANASGFNVYVGGRFFDPTFYAPKDEVVLEFVAPLFAEPCSFPAAGDPFRFSGSYILSPAAMFHPDVMAIDDPDDPDENGWRSPNSFDEGYASPTVSQALHPAQKTRMLEHHWLQNPDDLCNPGFVGGPYDGCTPYFFNHSLRSRPLTLFFDGHVRELSVLEAMQSDGRVRAQTDDEDYLWSVDTSLGQDGYFSAYGYDQAVTSYHILTTRGIRGRDTVNP